MREAKFMAHSFWPPDTIKHSKYNRADQPKINTDQLTMSSKSTCLLFILTLFLMLPGCISSQKTVHQGKIITPKTVSSVPLSKDLNRPVPNSISYEIPDSYMQAIKNGTRTKQGKPGPNYWQQYSRYTLNAKIVPEAKKLIGSGQIAYTNNSPDTLDILHFELALNNRKGDMDTNIVKMDAFSVNGHTILKGKNTKHTSKAGYFVKGTKMVVVLADPILPGKTAQINMKWHFRIPASAAGGRVGYYGRDNCFFMAYWYPQIRVYDDVNGWYTAGFKPQTEFYHEFADYELNLTVPEQWIVNSTGALKNAKEILQDDIFKRLQKAYSGTDVVQVVGAEDFGDITQPSKNGYITWRYKASQVNDVTFTVTKNRIWDATTTTVGNRDGNGKTNNVNINTIYRPEDTIWKKAARFSRDIIQYLSKDTGLPYPWPHMTAVASPSIGGGMEYPMMTKIGTYMGNTTYIGIFTKSNDYNFYRIFAHELAHMWDPMQLATNERRYAWMNEGHANFETARALQHFLENSQVKTNKEPALVNGKNYLLIAGTNKENAVMRWSKYDRKGAYHVASYWKPAAILIALQGVLGDELFNKAYRTYLKTWQFKHPYPWDMFKTFETVTSRDLDWFWRSWYYTTWTLDQAVSEVRKTAEGTKITIEDLGETPMPSTIAVTLDNGQTIIKRVDVKTWLHGAVETTVTVHSPADVIKVEIDPKHQFPDVNRSNNVWKKT